mgnify:CR=1 FL=1
MVRPMNILRVFILLVIPFSVLSQKNMDTILSESIAFQKETNHSYADSNHSPLTPEDLTKFDKLPFFEIDSNFYVIAKFVKSSKSKSVKFKTSTDRKPKYEIYGTIFFTIYDIEYSLKVYQSHSLREREEFKNYLFLPFSDLTNGSDSYGGGRYIDLTIPTEDEIVINFNKAYNPYCAYSSRYSCPVVPEENFLNVEIRAGVMAPKSH